MVYDSKQTHRTHERMYEWSSVTYMNINLHILIKQIYTQYLSIYKNKIYVYVCVFIWICTFTYGKFCCMQHNAWVSLNQ